VDRSSRRASRGGGVRVLLGRSRSVPKVSDLEAKLTDVCLSPQASGLHETRYEAAGLSCAPEGHFWDHDRDLKRAHSPDVDDPISFRPSPLGHFGVLFQLMVGLPGEGEESFDVIVCSPSWLTDRLGADPVLGLRHHLLMADWNWNQVSSFVEDCLSTIDGPIWPEVAAVVGRPGRWEFEDYADE